MSAYDPMEFPPFAVTTDLVIFTLRGTELRVLLTRRANAPFKDRWALPGGFVGPSQSLLETAQQKLSAKTGIDLASVHLEQVQSFGEPKRDPRMRVVSVAYMAFVHEPGDPKAGKSETEAAWVPLQDASQRQLAFDHKRILEVGLLRARAKIEYSTLAVHFCNPEFTISELREVYETVWDTKLDPGNFARKVSAVEGFIEETGETVSHGKGRPAKTYRAGRAEIIYPPLQQPDPR